MFRTAIIAANDVHLRWMQSAALHYNRLQVEHCRDRYPAAYELQQLLSLASPDVVFLDLKEPDIAVALAGIIREVSVRTAIVGLGDEVSDQQLEGTGIATAVGCNQAPEELSEAVKRALHMVRPIRHKALFSFLPAKAGNGCSTVAINTAINLGSCMKKKVVVLEADLRSGTMAIALNTTPAGSIQSLLGSSDPLDRLRWEQLSQRLHRVDWLFSSRKTDSLLADWTDYYQLLDFTASRYDVIVVDLPEVTNPATAEIVRTSSLVFVVCTQEVLSLKLAEQRGEELSAWGVPSENVRILVNRFHSKELPREEMEKILKRPITATFPNDYPGCRSAILKGGPVSAESKLGAAFLDFAEQLDNPVPGSVKQGRFARLLSTMSGR